ncbi:MAG: hypothetical protein D6723_03065 [Acidobacteria bacterium]|nr:MAG: hypothetical protein D6723_03065 [Acidobacteriota bacterium]
MAFQLFFGGERVLGGAYPVAVWVEMDSVDSRWGRVVGEGELSAGVTDGHLLSMRTGIKWGKLEFRYRVEEMAR